MHTWLPWFTDILCSKVHSSPCNSMCSCSSGNSVWSATLATMQGLRMSRYSYTSACLATARWPSNHSHKYAPRNHDLHKHSHSEPGWLWKHCMFTLCWSRFIGKQLEQIFTRKGSFFWNPENEDQTEVYLLSTHFIGYTHRYKTISTYNKIMAFFTFRKAQ